MSGLSGLFGLSGCLSVCLSVLSCPVLSCLVLSCFPLWAARLVSGSDFRFWADMQYMWEVPLSAFRFGLLGWSAFRFPLSCPVLRSALGCSAGQRI